VDEDVDKKRGSVVEKNVYIKGKTYPQGVSLNE